MDSDKKRTELAARDHSAGDRRWLWWMVIIGAVFLLLGLTYGGYRWYWIAQVDSRIAEIRAQGYPVTLEELDAWYEYPDGDNAADVYLKAFAAYAAYVPLDDEKNELVPIVGTGELPEDGGALPPEMLKAIEEHIAENETCLKLLHEAAQIKGCRYPVDLTQGFQFSLSHLGGARSATRLLVLEAVLAAEKDKPERVTDAVCSSLAVAQSLDRCPLLITELVRFACHGLSAVGLRRAVTRAQLTDQQLARIASALKDAEDDESFRRALVGEVCTMVAIFERGFSGLGAEAWFDSEFSASRFRTNAVFGFLEQEELLLINFVMALQEAYGKPWPERLRQVAADRGRFEAIALNGNIGVADILLVRKYLLAPALVPSLELCLVEAARTCAALRAARTALAVESFRLKHKRPPDKLDDLVPDFIEAIPDDPFDGKPLRYKKLDKGYVVYSIGENKVDDGGVFDPSGGEDDPSFTVKR